MMTRKFKKPENKFNLEEYTALINKAIGNRSKTQFAEDTGLSIYYISRCANGKLDKAPRPNTIASIAAVAQNGVTYDQLLMAAGYKSVPLVFAAAKEYNKSILMSPERARFVKMGIATISIALSKSKYPYYSDGEISEKYFDFAVHVQSGEDMVKWQFQFLTTMPPKNPNKNLTEELYYYYSNGAASPKRLAVFHTFVTESSELFEAIVANAPVAVARYSSVMLINTSNFTIVKTQVLKGPEPGGLVLPTLECTG